MRASALWFLLEAPPSDPAPFVFMSRPSTRRSPWRARVLPC